MLGAFSLRFGSYDYSVLLDHLDGLIWTLHFTCATNQAVFNVSRLRFCINDLEYANWTCVFACSTAIALVIIDLNFDHFDPVTFLGILSQKAS